MRIERANEMTEFKGVVDILNQPASVRPPLLYKYCVFNKWTPRIFLNNEVYFCSPNDFNDPFDSIVRFTCKGSKKQKERFIREHIRNFYPHVSAEEALSLEETFTSGRVDSELMQSIKMNFMERRGRTGVYCMTEEKKHILMWSHYAKRHTGFCLEFKTDDLFFQSVHLVRYPPSVKVPCMNLLPNWNRVIERGKAGLLTKAKEWKYEHEWRIIDLEKCAGVRQFPPTVLHGVILGCRISENDKRQIVEWCKERSPRPILYYAREKEMEYGLDIDPVKY